MSKVKILHTADWHIGKQLHKFSLEEDLTLFLQWLEEQIKERKPDLLLVSGDIFDTAFPSSQSLAQYYRFLTRLIGTKCKVVITGGNHDSPGVLNAPKDLLRFLDIRVVGSVPESSKDHLLLFDDLGLAVAAVPFLRENDLRRSVSGLTHNDRLEMIRQGIRIHYEQVADFHHGEYRDLTLIGMGHLLVQGVSTSDSERDIHTIGGLAAFGTDHFPQGFDYMALGHIHRPQQPAHHIRYSGSPVPLSFSERSDNKFVLEIILEDGELMSIESLFVPKFRELRKFSGSLEEVREHLSQYEPTTQLAPLIELDIIEPLFDPAKSLQFDRLLKEFEDSSFRIIKPRLTFENRAKEAGELFATGTQVEDLSPAEVFRKKLQEEGADEDTQQLLLEAFEELTAELLHS